MRKFEDPKVCLFRTNNQYLSWTGILSCVLCSVLIMFAYSLHPFFVKTFITINLSYFKPLKSVRNKMKNALKNLCFSTSNCVNYCTVCTTLIWLFFFRKQGRNTDILREGRGKKYVNLAKIYTVGFFCQSEII